MMMAILNFYNYEHVKELGSVLNGLYAGFLSDPEFLYGSALHIADKKSFFLSLTLAAGFFWIWDRERWGRKKAFSWMVAGLAFCFASQLGVRQEIRRWRQIDFVVENISLLSTKTIDMLGGESLADTDSEKAESLESSSHVYQRLDDVFKSDLSGAPAFSDRNANKNYPNILVVVVESLTGGLIPTVNGGRVYEGIRMKHIDDLSKQGVVFRNVINPSRQTNRGEYALFCGDFDNMTKVDSKMTFYSDIPNPTKCIPSALAENGYQTAYIQAANLSFMQKNRFMEKAGFQDVLGELSFDKNIERSKWGVNDEALYEKAVEYIRKASQSSRPWFVATLNIGTHHPGFVPEHWSQKQSYENDLTAAYAYADESVGRFLDQLRKENLLNNTLVVITGDESKEINLSNDLNAGLSAYWGTMIMFGDGLPHREVKEYYTQSDLSLSLLDYLGLGEKYKEDFYGRSMFRTYATPRDFIFGHNRSSLIWGFDGKRRLTSCESNSWECQSYAVAGDSFFNDGIFQMRSTDHELASLIHSFALRNEQEEKSVLRKLKKVGLTRLGPVPVVGEQFKKFISREVGPVPAGWVSNVKIELEVLSGTIEVALDHFQSDQMEVTREEDLIPIGKKLLKTGDRLYASYGVTGEDYQTYERPNLEIRRFGDTDAKVLVKNAVIEFSPASFLATDSKVISRSMYVF